MQIKKINFNSSQYKYDLSAVTDKDWLDFARDIALEKGDKANTIKLIDVKVVIRDNVAKFKVAYEDGSYHEYEYHLDEFGRISQNYQDEISALFQGIMSKHYGKGYDKALVTKIKAASQTAQN